MSVVSDMRRLAQVIDEITAALDKVTVEMP